MLPLTILHNLIGSRVIMAKLDTIRTGTNPLKKCVYFPLGNKKPPLKLSRGACLLCYLQLLQHREDS
jgi:hypothetical protein